MSSFYRLLYGEYIINVFKLKNTDGESLIKNKIRGDPYDYFMENREIVCGMLIINFYNLKI